jgi:hypothetical protein
MAKEITIMHCFSDKKVYEIPIPNTKDNKDVVATVVVPLICWKTNADSIELELQTRGKIKKKISIIKTTLQAGSAYMVRCKNHYSMNPSSESANPCCCKANTTNCALHCATHQLNLNIQQYMRVLVILYIYPTDEILLPPAPPTVSRSDLFMYDEKYFRIIENKGDGLCLFYSVSHFLKEHTNSTDGYTLQKGRESLTKITNFDTLTGSGIIELVARFVGDLTDEEFHTMTEYNTYPPDIDFVEKIESFMPSKSDIKRLDHPWVKKLLGQIIDAVNGTWPNEFQAYILSKMLQLRIVIIQDHY